jgi:predicted ATPase
MLRGRPEASAKMLESLRLIDFKSFVDETIPLAPITFLVGANAAGKSNVLDALRFLHGMSYDLRLAEVLDGEEGRAPDRWRGVRGGAREAARYGTDGFAILGTWTVGSAVGTHVIRCEMRPTVRIIEDALVGDGGAEPRSAAMKRIRFVEIQPERMRELSHSKPPLRDDGSNLSAVLRELARDPETRKTFIEWVSELCAPEVADIDFIEVEELGDVMAVLIERDGRRISARSMSDGTLRFLGILTALYTAEPDSILCFEELGAGLHPSRVRLLLELLKTVHRERGVQTIVTTHSPSLLRWLDEERLHQVVLLARTPDHPGTVVRRFGDLPGFFDAVRSLGLEEMFGTQWLEAAL